MSAAQSDDTARLLAAGGIAAVGAKIGKGEVVDTVVARAYRHPVLGARAVVRLAAENVAAGDDLEMSVLGFGAAEPRGAVGLERRRALGFPAWALVHDPKNARYALDVVGELKQHARRAKSKPGFAKEGIDALAAKLGKTVPQFLPSFYEEAGRAFVVHGAPSFAATCFGKAREAEDVHALDVDEQQRVDAFLEFALAGAVTTKALSAYAKDLAKHHAPAAAYAHFRQLCVQRTLGGMPPWSGMAKELRRLAKAAKLDVDAEDAALVAEIVESPALGKATAELWREYGAPFLALGKASPGARQTLLELFPTGTRAGGAEVDEVWLELVVATGGVDSLRASPPGAPAAWFDKLVAHLGRHYREAPTPRAVAILRTLAPRLVADGVPIHAVDRRWRIDIDLAELALELGVAVALPADGTASFQLQRWLETAAHPDCGRDPVRIAAHPVLGPVLGTTVAPQIGTEPFDTTSRGKAGFLAAKRGWLTAILARAAAGGVPGLDEALATLDKSAHATLFGELPDLHAQLAAVDIAPILARSLRIGIFDELGWPALEDAARELAPEGDGVGVHGGLPAVVLASATRLIAVGARGRLGVFDLVLPPKSRFHTARFIGGQFFVVFTQDGVAGLRGAWSAAPHDVFELDGRAHDVAKVAPAAVVLSDGAWREGTVTIRAGERRRPDGRLVAFDGATAWCLDVQAGKARLREVGESGELGRASTPAFFEAGLADGWSLDTHGSYLVPAPDGLTASPLGLAAGMLGVRAVHQGEPRKQTARELTRIDGARALGAVGLRARELLDLPGADVPRTLWSEPHWRETATTWLADQSTPFVRSAKIGAGDNRYWRGWFTPLVAELWHQLAPRDDAGSRRLRAITDADARALIAAAAAASDPAALPIAAVAAALPQITHAQLARGIAGYVAMAAALQARRDQLVAERAPAAATAAPRAGIDDATLTRALGGWSERSYRRGGSAFTQLAEIAAMFASDDRSAGEYEISTSSIDWLPFAVAPGALAFLATAIGTPAADRGALARLLAAIGEDLPDPGKLRLWGVTGSLASLLGSSTAAGRWQGGNAYFVAAPIRWQGHGRVLEYAPDGVWRGLADVAPHMTWIGGAPLADGEPAAIAAAAATGQTSWRDDAPAELATATGMTPSEAAFLLAGCPCANDASANFLPKELREAIGLKAAQAQLARDALNAVPRWKRIAVIDAAGRLGAAALLAGGAAAALGERWVKLLGARVAVPEALVAAADDELDTPLKPAVALAMIADAGSSPLLGADAVHGLDGNGAVHVVSAAEPLVGQTAVASAPPAFAPDVARTIAQYLPFLFGELPVGDPLRAQAALAHAQVLARLASPTLLVSGGTRSYSPDDSAAIDKLLANLGGVEVPGFNEGLTGLAVRGAVIVRRSSKLEVILRPAELDGPTIAALAPVLETTSVYSRQNDKIIALLRSPAYAAYAARIAETPVPAGGWEQDPRASAPDLVARASQTLGVSADAAALYLQYLVLLWPTAKLLAIWNGWKPKQLAAAQAELVGKELVLEAKRERAQRGHFLPGGWEAFKSPTPPMESWKLPLYGVRGADGAVGWPLSRVLPVAPFHMLFDMAWARITAGDVPKYEDVKR